MAEKQKKQKNAGGDLSRLAAEKRRDMRKARPTEEKTTMDTDFEDEHLKPNPTPDVLGEKLVEEGVIDRHQLFQALNESYRSGKTLGEALVELKFIDKKELQKLLKGK